MVVMSDVTLILSKIEAGEEKASEQLLPLVYDELRRLASRRMEQESPGHTLQATALVHDAYIRLVDVEKAQHWDSRGHFFAAAAESMRRILIDHARKKARVKRAANLQEIDLDAIEIATSVSPESLLRIDEALTSLAQDDPPAAEIVKLRYFAGLSVEQAAEVLAISPRTAYRHWNYARAWLCGELLEEGK
jgi:RNA polymerase sigma factor (TIGR02999 family)